MATKRSKRNLTKEEVSQLLAYDPDTGRFTWKVRRRRRGGFVLPGDEAGHITPNGYRRIGLGGVSKLAHHVAWLMMKGDWPPMDMDHKDRNRANNKWSNLRLATSSQNNSNKSLQSNNKSGKSGVRWEKERCVWKAYIKKDSKYIYLGRFHSLETAIIVRKAAEPKYFGEFAVS